MKEPHNNRCDNNCAHFGEPTVHDAAIAQLKIIGSCRETGCQITESNKVVIDTIGCATFTTKKKDK